MSSESRRTVSLRFFRTSGLNRTVSGFSAWLRSARMRFADCRMVSSPGISVRSWRSRASSISSSAKPTISLKGLRRSWRNWLNRWRQAEPEGRGSSPGEEYSFVIRTSFVLTARRRDLRPRGQQPVDFLEQATEINRLDLVLVAAGGDGLLAVAVHRVGGEGDHGDVLRGRVGFQLP